MSVSRSVAAAAALLMFLAACSSDEATSPQVADAPEATPTPDPTCPLTGEEPGDVDLTRPAIAVKIENSAAARPQAGLEDADVVFEEVVEGGITRFMAIYHCGDSERVGPVRSARFDDAGIVKPFTRVLAFSGSNDIVEKELKDQKLILVDEIAAPDALFRVPPGVLEIHNLFGDVSKIRALDATAKADAPKFAFTFGELPAGASDAKKIKMNFTSSIAIEYRWKGGAWKRWEDGEPFMTAEGEQVAVPNLLIQEVEVNNSPSIFDVAGNPSPDIKLEGKGRALLFRDGKVIEGTWDAGKKGGTPVFKTLSGEPMPFAIGPVWIELVPSKAGEVKGKVSFK